MTNDNPEDRVWAMADIVFVAWGEERNYYKALYLAERSQARAWASEARSLQARLEEATRPK